MDDTVSMTDSTDAPYDGASDAMTVGATAALVGLSVRTLHHWDEIGLVVPSARTWAGYRLYDAADIARLHRVLVYRELGMPLAGIRALIDDPEVDERAHLASQRSLLTERIARLQQMVCAVDSMMEADAMNTPLTPDEQARAFGSRWDDRYATEAEERWGATPEWEHSRRVTERMSEEDFAAARAEIDELDGRLAAAMRSGLAPGDDAVLALAEEHRLRSIGRWFPVSHAQHVLIARGYTDDPRFTAHDDAREAGLAAWLREAIEANARAHGVDPATATWA